MTVHGDQSFDPEFAEHAIDVRCAEPHCITDALLRQQHLKGILRGVPDGLKPGLHLQQEMGKPLERLAASGIMTCSAYIAASRAANQTSAVAIFALFRQRAANASSGM